MDLHMGPDMDSHMGFHKGKMIPIPIGHGKLGIPMPNLVIVARATFMLEGACSQLTNLNFSNQFVSVRIQFVCFYPIGDPYEITWESI